MKQYKTIITKDYVPDWSVANGIREWVTNALDSPAKFQYILQDDYIELRSVGITLPAKCLALGVSSHRNDPNAVGQHGEGMLVACVPLLREGYELIFRNGGVVWVPEFIYDNDFETEILVINEYPNYEELDNQDFVVCIKGDLSEVIDEVRENNLYLQDDIGKVYEGKKGRVLVDRPEKLYVGGVFVTSLPKHKYGYDFKPQYLQLNRDRKVVNSWDLQMNTSTLLGEVLPTKELGELVIQKAECVNYGFLHSYPGFTSEVADHAYDLFVDKYGDDAVVAYGSSEEEELKNKGYKNIEVEWNDAYVKAIKSSPKYQQKLQELEVEPLEVDERSPVELLWAFVDKCEKEDYISFIELSKLIEVFDKRGVYWDNNYSEEYKLPF